LQSVLLVLVLLVLVLELVLMVVLMMMFRGTYSFGIAAGVGGIIAMGTP
jgi:hypothetical protein